LVLDDVDVAKLTLVSPAGTATRFSEIRGSAKITRTRIAFEGLRVRGAGWAIEEAGGTLHAREPLAMEVATGWSLTGETRVAGTAHATGNLDRLLVDARVAVPAVARIEAELTQVSAALRWRGTAEVERLDLAQWIESPPAGPLA